MMMDLLKIPDTDRMAIEFQLQLSRQPLSRGQQLVFQFLRNEMLRLVVKELKGKSR
jgi:hypothetical protein